MTSIFQKKFRLPDNKIIDSKNDYFTNKAGIEWHKAGRNRIMELTKNKKNVIDVGAHVGITCVHWLAGGFEKIYAFEINPTHYECLVENTSEFDNQVVCFNHGCGDKNMKVKAAYKNSRNSGSFQIIEEKNYHFFDEKSLFDVEIKKLDEYEYDNVSIIKIDVEGWELEVLKGGLITIEKHRPLLFVEYTQGNGHKTLHRYENNEFLELLISLNYKILETSGDTIIVPTELFN